MAIAMIMTWPGVGTEEYDKVRAIVDWEGNPAAGGRVHVVTHDGNALRITDVWDSAEDFQTFVDERLMPGVAEAGIASAPQVDIYPLHALWQVDA